MIKVIFIEKRFEKILKGGVGMGPEDHLRGGMFHAEGAAGKKPKVAGKLKKSKLAGVLGWR